MGCSASDQTSVSPLLLYLYLFSQHTRHPQTLLHPLVEGVDGQHRVAAHVAVAVLQIGEDGGHEGLQDLLLLDAAQEAQRDAADVLIGVLQVVAQILTNQDLVGGGGGGRETG